MTKRFAVSVLGVAVLVGGCSKKEPPPSDNTATNPPAPSPVIPASPDPVPAARPVAPPSTGGCVMLGWSGGAAGKGYKMVKSALEVQDDGAKLVIKYEWKGGVMTLFRSKSDPNAYSGQWQQQGGKGGANLNFNEPYTKATGSWSNGGSTAQSAMTVSPCG